MATKTWIASSAGNASTDANWSGGAKPATGDDVVFDATSVNNCSWDIDAASVTVGSITIASGYTGTVTQAATADIGIGAGGFSMAGGTLTANETKWIYCAGDFNSSAGTFTSAKARVVMTGGDKTIYGRSAFAYHTIRVSASINATVGSGNFLVANLTVDSGKTLTILSGKSVFIYDYVANGTLSNSGIIGGAGTFGISLKTNKTFALGDIRCSLSVTSDLAGATNSFTFTLSQNENFQAPITIGSGHASYTVTLDLGGKSLSCSALTVSTRGILTNSGAEADCVVTNAFTLSGASSSVTGNVKLNCGSYVQSDGTLTQASDISIGAGGASISGGTFTGLETKTVSCAGTWNHTVGTITANKTNLVMSGDAKSLIVVHATSFLSITISGSITVTTSTTTNCNCLSLNVTGSATIASGKNLNILESLSALPLQNTGVINGPGNLKLFIGNNNPTLQLSKANAPFTISKTSGYTAAKTVTASGDIILGSSLSVSSGDSTGTITLDLAGRSLTANGITIGTRGIVLGGEGVVRNLGNFDSSAGTWTPETCQYVQAAPGTIKLAAGQSFNDLMVCSGGASLASNVTVNGIYAHAGAVNQGAFALTYDATQEYAGLRRPLRKQLRKATNFPDRASAALLEDLVRA